MIKDKTKRNEYFRNYYHTHPECKSKTAERMRLKYWREKLIKLLNISPNATVTLNEIKKLSEDELKAECYKITP